MKIVPVEIVMRYRYLVVAEVADKDASIELSLFMISAKVTVSFGLVCKVCKEMKFANNNKTSTR